MSERHDLADHDLLVQVVALPDGDMEELADKVLLLREDLLELDVATVDTLGGEEAPESSKGGLAIVAGWLTVNLGPAALRSVIQRVAAWSSQNNRTVEISLGGDVLKLSGISPEQQSRLIDEWLTRHGALT